MEDSLIQKTISRSNRSLLLLCALGIAAVFLLVALNFRYFYNFFLGPVDITDSELSSFTSATEPQRYWLNVNGYGMVNTGIQLISTSDSGRETVEATYFAMILEKNILLVEQKGDILTDTLPGQQTGWLTKLSSEESEQIVSALEQDEPSIAGTFLPFKLETGNFRINGYIGLVVGLITLLLCAWGLVTVILRVSDPNTHPVMKKLARFGPVELVSSRIESELAVPHTTLGKLHLTKSWLVYATNTNLMATRFEDIAWLYKHVQTHRSYGIVVSRIYTAMVFDRFGVQLNLVAGNKEAPVDEMLQAILARAPWAVTGYSKETLNVWKKHRADFLSAVEKRKLETQAQTN